MPVAENRRKWPCILLPVLAVFIVVLLVFPFVSPLPATFILKFAFRNGVAVAPDNYEEMKAQVTAIKDLTYPSLYRDNLADVYFLKDATEPLPVVLWVHGGAFVGGDKDDIEIYATALAYEGFAVVSMNYQLAPKAKYPTPVIQTGEACLWLEDLAAQYPLDTERLILAGDSAGAHIVAQFAAIQSNRDYAEEMAMEQIIPVGIIKSVLLFCGPFDIAKMGTGGNALINFFIDRAAWAYFGDRNWAESFSQQATIVNHITAKFPATFISDGNTGSFEDHARGLASVLEHNNVPVETYFVDPTVEIAKHEYQFIMNTPAGVESFQKALIFLRTYSN